MWLHVTVVISHVSQASRARLYSLDADSNFVLRFYLEPYLNMIKT
jgi:hypothetical protein